MVAFRHSRDAGYSGCAGCRYGFVASRKTLLERFRSLSAHQRHLVTELVAQLALDWAMGRKEP
jgi:hypothetical protein